MCGLMFTRFGLLLAGTWAIVACTPVGDAVDIKVSPNYYFGFLKRSIVFSYGGNCLGPGCTEVAGAEVATFRPLSARYAADAHHVYYEARRLKDEDPRNFRALLGPYGVGKTQAYFQGEPFFVDVASFHAVSYGKEPQLDHYARDDHQVYFRDQVISRSPTTFVALPQLNYFRDAEHVHFMSGGVHKVLSSEPSYFRFLQQSDGSDSIYALDRTYVYVFARALPLADPATFHLLCATAGSAYAADQRHVYRFDQIVEGAAPDSFTPDCR